MVPLYAAGAITEKEVAAFETKLISEQFGLICDVKNVDIAKVMDLFIRSTATVVSKMGSTLRRNVYENRKAKPIKNFIIKGETTEYDIIREQERTT